MSASFASALRAAHDAASAQHYPQGVLYVIATPIGNLADITLRALHVLQIVDAIACEDTRHTQSLLRAYGMERPGNQMLAVHQHNEATAAINVIDHLQRGQRVAYVSDAGTPGVSDPGARLVSAIQAAGLRAVPIPGASAVTSALSVSGAASLHDASGFLFAGFLSTKSAERRNAIRALAQETRCTILLEAPHRVGDLAHALLELGARKITLAREITKQFEEIATLPAQDLPAWLTANPQRSKGEFVLVLHPFEAPSQQEDESIRILQLLLDEVPVKTAVRLAAEITGTARNSLYDTALRIKQDAIDNG